MPKSEILKGHLVGSTILNGSQTLCDLVGQQWALMETVIISVTDHQG